VDVFRGIEGITGNGPILVITKERSHSKTMDEVLSCLDGDIRSGDDSLDGLTVGAACVKLSTGAVEKPKAINDLTFSGKEGKDGWR